MAKPSLFHSLIDSFGKARQKSDRPPPAKTAAPRATVQPSEDFEAKLNKALSLHGKESSARVYLIDLERLRGQFGEKWDRMHDKIHGIVHESIERHLAFADLYSQYTETSYVVVFAQLSRHEAQLKCLLIAKEMARRLIGTEAASGEIRVKTADVGADGTLVFREIPDFEHMVGAFGVAPAPALENRNLVVTPKLTTIAAMDWDEVEFIYRPLLNLRGMVVSTYICLPVRQDGSGNFDSSYGVLENPGDIHQVADLDTLTLATVATEAGKMAAAGTKALLSLPVHFETLADHNNRLGYLHHCRNHLELHAERLVFELVGLPEGVPQFRLVDLVSMLRPYARAVIARFGLDRKLFTACRSAGLHAVGADIHYSDETETAIMRQMNHFVDAANHEFLKTYIHGIRTISLNTAAVTAGFDYIDGYALTSVANVPKQARRYDLHSLYRPLILAGPDPTESG